MVRYGMVWYGMGMVWYRYNVGIVSCKPGFTPGVQLGIFYGKGVINKIGTLKTF